MKKIFLSLILIIGLFGCSEKNTAAETKYYDMLKLISQREEYSTSSDNFSISAEISPISEGRYRYFVTLDKPKLAMYEVEILAIEEGKEYINEVAANAGVLLDDIYNMMIIELLDVYDCLKETSLKRETDEETTLNEWNYDNIVVYKNILYAIN